MTSLSELNALRLRVIESVCRQILPMRCPDLSTDQGRRDFALTIDQLSGATNSAEQPVATSDARSGLGAEVLGALRDFSGVAIIGDNAHVLPHLTSVGPATLVYMDPPYNTGKDMMYGDSFGRERSWAELMLVSLEESRKILSDNGVVCISLDENEITTLRLLADAVFGTDNAIAEFVWETKRAARGVPPRNMLMNNHEYVVCYAKDRDAVRLNGLPRDASDFVNPDHDPRGPWRSESMKATGRGGATYTIEDPETGRKFTSSWAFSKETMASKIKDQLVLFPNTAEGTPRQKKHLSSYRNSSKASVTSLGWFSTERSTRDLMELFDGVKVFPFPKPVPLLRYLIEQFTQPGDLIVDPFAGSGTTGHAVMELNNRYRRGDLRSAGSVERLDPEQDIQPPEPRRCVLIQQPEPCPAHWPAAQAGYSNVADVMAERLRRVAEIYDQTTWPTVTYDCLPEPTAD